MSNRFEIAVIGAGIAGASVAAQLASQGKRVVLLEMERQPGYHTTGRSAAVFSPSYGPAPIRAMTRASEAFFRAPPDGFTDSALFSPRLVMFIARPDQEQALHDVMQEVGSDAFDRIDAAHAQQLNPLLRAGYASSAILEKGGQDIDVSALHQGFLRQFRADGGTLVTDAEVSGLTQTGTWQIDTRAGTFAADIVVNAAGAWADTIGRMAGAEHIGLTPKRRTAALIPAPDAVNISQAPITIDVQEQFYLKPDAGRVLISPADETPCAPCDVQPEELDIAICVDRIETAFDLNIRRIDSKWAGLRSFVPDKSPVAGFSEDAPGFYWLAGQGGYGIQTSPAIAQFAASQILERPLPAILSDHGVIAGDLSPARLRGAV